MIPWVSCSRCNAASAHPQGDEHWLLHVQRAVNVLNDGASLLANMNPPSPQNFIRKNMSPALVWIRQQSRTYSYIPDVHVRVVHPKMYWLFFCQKEHLHIHIYVYIFKNMHISMFIKICIHHHVHHKFYWLLYILFLPLGFVFVGGELAEARARIFHTEWVAGAATHGKGACHLEVSQMTGFFRGKLQICCCW